MKRNAMDGSRSGSNSDQSPKKKKKTPSSSAAPTASASCLNADFCAAPAKSPSGDRSRKFIHEYLEQPASVLEEIFLNVPPHQVVCVCRLVCCQWKEVVDSESLWRKRCRREGYPIYNVKQELKLFYFLSKKRRNLLKNPNGEEGMNGWEILRNGGDKWAALGIRLPHPNETVTTNFVTSFEMCTKSQLIDLEKEGYSSSLMDLVEPSIKISDWFLARSDCGSRYNIWVQLLNQKKELVEIFSPETVYCRAECEEWNQITHVFHKYGPGVRYIQFTHGGKDLKWWKGHFGIHITGSCVEILPTMDT